MTPVYPRLTSHLERANLDGYLIDAHGEDANQYYLSGYHAPDNFVRMDDCIVASGAAAARGHDSGSGALEANTPIVVDIFPRHKRTRYFADMTRTFVKGEPGLYE